MFVEQIHWTFFMGSEGFCIGMDLKDHFGSPYYSGQERDGSVLEACSPAVLPAEAKSLTYL